MARFFLELKKTLSGHSCDITQDEALEHLNYCSETGHIAFWLRLSGSVAAILADTSILSCKSSLISSPGSQPLNVAI